MKNNETKTNKTVTIVEEWNVNDSTRVPLKKRKSNIAFVVKETQKRERENYIQLDVVTYVQVNVDFSWEDATMEQEIWVVLMMRSSFENKRDYRKNVEQEYLDWFDVTIVSLLGTRQWSPVCSVDVDRIKHNEVVEQLVMDDLSEMLQRRKKSMRKSKWCYYMWEKKDVDEYDRQYDHLPNPVKVMLSKIKTRNSNLHYRRMNDLIDWNNRLFKIRIQCSFETSSCLIEITISIDEIKKYNSIFLTTEY